MTTTLIDDTLIDDMLNFDPFQVAERLTGDSCKDSGDTAMLSLAIAIHHNKHKNEVLHLADDTTIGSDLVRYQRIIDELGFTPVLVLPFEAPDWNAGDPPRQETFFIYAHLEKGILLVFDTYDGDGVNGGKFYYCWKPTDLKNRFGITSSGGFRNYGTEDRYWAGYHDCREAIRHHIRQLDENGTFLPIWPKEHDIFLWFLHYADTMNPSYNVEAINAERIAMLPGNVREMIGR